MEKHQPDPGRLYPVIPPCVKDIVERIDAQAEVSYPDSASSRVVMTRELLIEALGEAYTRLEAANKVLDTPSPFKLPEPSHTPAMPPVQLPKANCMSAWPFPQTKPAAWGMTYMGGLMPTVYVVEGDAVKEFKRRNTVYPDSAEHRKLVAVYTVPVEEAADGVPEISKCPNSECADSLGCHTAKRCLHVNAGVQNTEGEQR